LVLPFPLRFPFRFFFFLAGGGVFRMLTGARNPMLPRCTRPQVVAEEWLLNAEYGFYPPNASYGAVPLASPLNHTYPGPWLAHTTKAVR